MRMYLPMTIKIDIKRQMLLGGIDGDYNIATYYICNRNCYDRAL